ncbi:hypothetical protein P7K49_026114 [Saguinus oedipus]|uniref:Uncharacterized protein n=1 Tax=Saguinus oedipus TaxID=9490 RepID=A0ABQ9UJX8_SAGOE|nr:hypothetical protein P7K49_026114 [Saguinus oedipus]
MPQDLSLAKGPIHMAEQAKPRVLPQMGQTCDQCRCRAGLLGRPPGTQGRGWATTGAGAAAGGGCPAIFVLSAVCSSAPPASVKLPWEPVLVKNSQEVASGRHWPPLSPEMAYEPCLQEEAAWRTAVLAGSPSPGARGGCGPTRWLQGRTGLSLQARVQLPQAPLVFLLQVSKQHYAKPPSAHSPDSK